MNSVINTVLLSTDMGFFERLAYGAQVFVIGILTVFVSLAILWGVIAIFKIFMYDLPQKKAKKKAEAALNTVVDADPDVSADTDAVEESDDTQLVAVITAAVAAYTAASGSALPFRVVSFKRVRGANGWSGADENESI